MTHTCHRQFDTNREEKRKKIQVMTSSASCCIIYGMCVRMHQADNQGMSMSYPCRLSCCQPLPREAVLLLSGLPTGARKLAVDGVVHALGGHVGVHAVPRPPHPGATKAPAVCVCVFVGFGGGGRKSGRQGKGGSQSDCSAGGRPMWAPRSGSRDHREIHQSIAKSCSPAGLPRVRPRTHTTSTTAHPP